MNRDETWFFEFADVVAGKTTIDLGRHDSFTAEMLGMIDDAVHDAVLATLHEAPKPDENRET